MLIETHKSLSDDKRESLMNKLVEWRGIAETGNKANIERMIRAGDFINGDQWDLALKEQLESKGKYCATIPLVRANLLQLVGHVVANPKDIDVKDTHGGLKILARAQSALVKHTIDDCHGMDAFVQWFTAGAGKGDGYLGLMVDEETDPLHSNLRIKVLNELDCLPDPTAQMYSLDGTTGRGDGAKYFFWDEWVDKEWAEEKWPDVKEQMQSQSPGWMSSAYTFMTRALTGVAGRSTESLSSRSSYSMPQFDKTRHRLTHCWWQDWRPCLYWYDSRQTELDALIVIEPEQMKAAKASAKNNPEIYSVTKSTVRVINHTLNIGGQFLENRVDEFNLTKGNLGQFPIVRFSAFFDHAKRTGIVDDMIGPQETLNWLRSLVVNIAKLLPNTGWKIKQDIDNYSAILKTHSGEAAQVIDLSKCGGAADKIEPSPFPIGLHQISELSKGEIREVSNIRTENPEQDRQEQSGRAILAKQQSAEQGVSPVLRMFDWSLRIFGNLLVNVNRCNDFYSDDEIKGMFRETDLIDDEMLAEARFLVASAMGIQVPEEPMPPNPADLTQGMPQDIAAVTRIYIRQTQIYETLMAEINEQARPLAIQMLIDAMRNPVAGRYHASVKLSPYSLTSRQKDMVMVMETNELLIASQYPPLPEKYILEASDIPNKDTLLRERGLT